MVACGEQTQTDAERHGDSGVSVRRSGVEVVGGERGKEGGGSVREEARDTTNIITGRPGVMGERVSG